uniref:Uncharacterized protein n=1 Tax=Arundo donax TaxID=35708 RepID=A0A0A9FI67_ARUDO
MERFEITTNVLHNSSNKNHNIFNLTT